MTSTELAHVTKRFGDRAALDDVSFAVGEGEVVALLGPNGAGKTTAIGVLLGLRRPDSGHARLFGRDPRDAGARVAVGVAPQEVLFPQTLRVTELVDLVRAHYPAPLATADLVQRFSLSELATRQLGGLSGGERRRVAVALAFAGAPRLVVLDEPSAGLDTPARRAVWDAVLAQAASGGTILLTTHDLAEADALATRVVVIASGRIVADGPAAEIKAAAGLTRIAFRAPHGLVVDGATRDGAFLRVLSRDAGATVERLVRDGIRLDELEVRPARLDEALATLAGDG